MRTSGRALLVQRYLAGESAEDVAEAMGSWSGTVAPDQCPTMLGGNPLPPLLIAHGKWWTLHAWVWMPNPEGVFHAKNPRVP